MRVKRKKTGADRKKRAVVARRGGRKATAKKAAPQPPPKRKARESASATSSSPKMRPRKAGKETTMKDSERAVIEKRVDQALDEGWEPKRIAQAVYEAQKKKGLSKEDATTLAKQVMKIAEERLKARQGQVGKDEPEFEEEPEPKPTPKPTPPSTSEDDFMDDEPKPAAAVPSRGEPDTRGAYIPSPGVPVTELLDSIGSLLTKLEPLVEAGRIKGDLAAAVTASVEAMDKAMSGGMPKPEDYYDVRDAQIAVLARALKGEDTADAHLESCPTCVAEKECDEYNRLYAAAKDYRARATTKGYGAQFLADFQKATLQLKDYRKSVINGKDPAGESHAQMEGYKNRLVQLTNALNEVLIFLGPYLDKSAKAKALHTKLDAALRINGLIISR